MNDPLMELSVTTLGELPDHPAGLFSPADRMEWRSLTPLRLASYLSNPRAHPDDPVLFELRTGRRLVAYRTLLPDHFTGQEGDLNRFAWFSGNFVVPEYRRRGLSTRLLKQAEEAWGGRLAYTNYAPASKAVYDHTERYSRWLMRPGKRFYLRSSAAELLEGRIGYRGLLKKSDRLINRIREPLLRRHLPPLPGGGNLSVTTHKMESESPRKTLDQLLDAELLSLIGRTQQNTLFGREIPEFDWILKYPWVTADPRAPEIPFPFSHRAERFHNHLVTVQDDLRGECGMMWVLIRDRSCSVPYLFHSHPALLAPMAAILVRKLITEECAYLTLRHPGLLEHLPAFRKLFLTVREMPQHYFAHNELAGTLSRLGTGSRGQDGGRQVCDGDGDMVFTG